MGQGGPTVVLDAGASGGSESWSEVQPKVAGFTRVCSYDRTNRGISDQGPIPNTSKQIVDDLEALLAAADIDGLTCWSATPTAGSTCSCSPAFIRPR